MHAFKKFFNILVFGFVGLSLLIICPSYATEKDATMANDDHDIISIVVDPNALGPNLPDETILLSVGKEMLRKHFQQDMSMSQSVRGNIALTNRETFQYQLMAMFLYKQSYTAVDHLIVFTLSGNHYTVISVK